jgi:hypothetical protein
MGLHKNIETPEEFLRLFYQFREWHQDQKVLTHQLSKSGDVVDIKHTPPLTWAAFDSWLFEKQIITDTEDYRQNTDDRYADFKGVVRAINKIMFSQKFEGAAVGAYNANIIARDLGLRDAKDVNNTGTINLNQITGMDIK